MLTEVDALGTFTTHTWSNGLEQTRTDALGRVSSHTWDSSKRRKLTDVDALGKVTSYGYDSSGNQTSIEDALGRFTVLGAPQMRLPGDDRRWRGTVDR